MPRDQLVLHLPMNEGKGSDLAARFPVGASFKAGGELTWAARGKFGAAPVIKTETPLALGDHGNFARKDAFSISLWVRPPRKPVTGSIVSLPASGSTSP